MIRKIVKPKRRTSAFFPITVEGVLYPKPTIEFLSSYEKLIHSISVIKEIDSSFNYAIEHLLSVNKSIDSIASHIKRVEEEISISKTIIASTKYKQYWVETLTPGTLRKVIKPDFIVSQCLPNTYDVSTELIVSKNVEIDFSPLQKDIRYKPSIESIFDYSIKHEITISKTIDKIFNFDFNTEIDVNKELTDLYAGKGISTTIDCNKEIESQFAYSIEYDRQEYTNIQAWEVANYVFVPDEPMPPDQGDPLIFPNNVLSFNVVQEFGSAYYTAEIKVQGISIPNKDEYVEIRLKDSQTGTSKIIFKGFVIEVSRDLKKNRNEATIRAVTNGWYLTQQNVPKDCAGTVPLHSTCFTFDYLEDMRIMTWIWYPRYNEIMLLWDYLFFDGTRTRGQVAYEYSNNHIWDRYEYSKRLGFLGDWNRRCNKEVLIPTCPTIIDQYNYHAKRLWKSKTTGWHGEITGLIPSRALYDNVNDLGSWAYPSVDMFDLPDMRNKTGNDRWDKPFNDFVTSKYDAIMQMSDYDNRIFHYRFAQSDSDIQVRNSGYADAGDLVAFWTPNTSANNNVVEPFSICLSVDANNDSTLLDITQFERDTERSIPNMVHVRGLNPDWGTEYFWDSTSPKDWYDIVYDGKHPVIRYKEITGVNNQTEVNLYAEEYYNRLQEGNVKYKAKFLSKTANDNGDTLLPGSNINIANVTQHSNDTFRILKIVHSKEGSNPTITNMEYTKVYDLGHPNTFDAGIMERILREREDSMETGWKEDTYQWLKTPRKSGIGKTPRLALGELVEANVSNTYDIRLLNSSQLVSKIRVI